MPGACTGKVALVTGASRGIGRAIALRLAAEGAAVAVCARPRPGFADLGTLDGVRDELTALGGPVLAVPFDLADPTTDRATLIDLVEDALGPVDVLVNNAAAGNYMNFLDWTDAKIAKVLELNFWAPWHLVRRTLPGMLERRSGWILNVSSQTAELPPGPPFPNTTPSTQGTIYGGSKAFLDRWTVSLAAEVFGRGVAVNTVAPEAAAATEVLVEYSNLPDHLYEPLETMAEAALALCTADPEVLTGQVTTSLALLDELARPVLDLRGEVPVAGWQPGELAPRIARMRAHSSGETASGPSNVADVLARRIT